MPEGLLAAGTAVRAPAFESAHANICDKAGELMDTVIPSRQKHMIAWVCPLCSSCTPLVARQRLMPAIFAPVFLQDEECKSIQKHATPGVKHGNSLQLTSAVKEGTHVRTMPTHNSHVPCNGMPQNCLLAMTEGRNREQRTQHCCMRSCVALSVSKVAQQTFVWYLRVTKIFSRDSNVAKR